MAQLPVGTYLEILLAAIAGTGTVRVGSKTATLTVVPGGPHHFTVGEALLAGEQIEAGASGTVQIGNVQVVIA